MNKTARKQLKRIAKPLNSLPIRCKCGGICFIMDEAEQEKSQEVKAFERENHVLCYALCSKCGNIYTPMRWKRL